MFRSFCQPRTSIVKPHCCGKKSASSERNRLTFAAVLAPSMYMPTTRWKHAFFFVKHESVSRRTNPTSLTCTSFTLAIQIFKRCHRPNPLPSQHRRLSEAMVRNFVFVAFLLAIAVAAPNDERVELDAPLTINFPDPATYVRTGRVKRTRNTNRTPRPSTTPSAQPSETPTVTDPPVETETPTISETPGITESPTVTDVIPETYPPIVTDQPVMTTEPPTIPVTETPTVPVTETPMIETPGPGETPWMSETPGISESPMETDMDMDTPGPSLDPTVSATPSRRPRTPTPSVSPTPTKACPRCKTGKSDNKHEFDRNCSIRNVNVARGTAERCCDARYPCSSAQCRNSTACKNPDMCYCRRRECRTVFIFYSNQQQLSDACANQVFRM